MGIVLAILIFGIIIFIHELGHFMAAKANGVKVNEFAIGMGPAIFKKKKGETLYALRCIPMGGYCAMEGEDTDSDNERAFGNKAVWRRMIIIVAGAFMNLLLGFVILLISTATSGAITSTTVSTFEENAKSHETGLEEGDKILKINGMKIFTANDMSYQFSNDEDGKFDIQVLRNGQKVDLHDVTFATNDKSMHIDFKVQGIKVTAGSAISQTFKLMATDSRLIVISLTDLIKGKYSIKDLSGPVGIVDSIDDVVDSTKSKDTGKIDWAALWAMMTNFSAFITINIGIFNLLPLPALDGGRFVFLLVEAIRRKPVKPEHEGWVHAIGMGILLLFMAVITVSDIIKIF